MAHLKATRGICKKQFNYKNSDGEWWCDLCSPKLKLSTNQKLKLHILRKHQAEEIVDSKYDLELDCEGARFKEVKEAYLMRK